MKQAEMDSLLQHPTPGRDCVCGNPDGTNAECERCRLIRRVRVLERALDTEVIEKALNSYYCQHTRDSVDGSGMQIVDMLSPPEDGDISRGKDEMYLLADWIGSDAIEQAEKELSDDRG